MNSLGKNFVFTSFGESHGRAIGGVMDGVPAGVRIDMDMIREALDKRAGRVKVKGIVVARCLLQETSLTEEHGFHLEEVVPMLVYRP